MYECVLIFSHTKSWLGDLLDFLFRSPSLPVRAFFKRLVCCCDLVCHDLHFYLGFAVTYEPFKKFSTSPISSLLARIAPHFWGAFYFVLMQNKAYKALNNAQ